MKRNVHTAVRESYAREEAEGNTIWKCKYCETHQYMTNPQSHFPTTRARSHLRKCPSVPENVKEMISEYEEDNSKHKKRKICIATTAVDTKKNLLDVLMVGTGEYTTGYVGGKAADSDKSAGVVALTMFDQRRLGTVGRVGLCGTNGKKMPGIRKHMKKSIADAYSNMDITCETFPRDGTIDREAYIKALDAFNPGDAVTIFTPDDTHFKIALAAIERKLHVLVTKPPVKTLADHLRLVKAAEKHGVLVVVEVHKRYDPIYRDARDRIRSLGDFSYFNAYMSQPKHQLETFRAWAGKSSDISYYLNSHHVDFHEWACSSFARPVRVTATKATGVAKSKGISTEDTITLTVSWQNIASGNEGIAVYTSSWVAPKADVHSQQRFFYMGHAGEIRIDQAHRGYTVATDAAGFGSMNPLFMKYTKSASDGTFAGQSGYGYVSFSAFVAACRDVNAGNRSVLDCNRTLPTISTTACATAVLEAGRRSLDDGGRPYKIVYENGKSTQPVRLEPVVFG